jgi:bisphosphoglycerate-independent phosphoglycerate mutase (AlkP superfamily)
MDEFSNSKTGFTELEAASLAVGLPEGLMGNSEVGHMNIGAGRVVWQDVVRIDQAIKKDEFSKNDVIKATCEAAKNGNGRLHLCGLISHGGVVRNLSTRWLGKKTHPFSALQARASICPPQSCQRVWSSQGLHTLLR